MPLTRLDNLYSSKTGKYLYVSPDDFNASDALDNRGNSPLRPFVSIQRAFLEVARYSYVPNVDNDRFDQFTIMLSPGNHYIDNRPGDLDVGNVPIFDYNPTTDEWNDNSIFDLGNPNNILYRFNGRDGGATIPRGTSLVGTDLRRTQVRALYVPDPADKDVPRCALFNVTGGCYFWQFTILDANDVNGPLNGKAYNQPGSTQLVTPLYSHHKMTNFVFADREDLGLLYRKIAKAFSKYQPEIDDVYTAESGRVENTWYSTNSYGVGDEVVFGGEAYKALQSSLNKRPDLEDTFWERLSTISREFDYRVQENRIVGPLSDTVQIDQFSIAEPQPGFIDLTVRTKINHGFFPGQYVAIANLGFNRSLEGVFQVLTISQTNPKEFTYRVNVTANAVGLNPNQAFYLPDPNATVQAEVDSVESASPYVFNVSIRSTWGICGIWADGRKATGFKSMVIAQYTGVSLQKDDRAFIRYDEFSNTWNEAPLTDAFATTPYHIKGDAYWKDDWRNFHVRASDDSFIQNVSIFAVGFADHFLLESGGDMSITNSNSNFGNTSMHSKGYKGFAFNQDKGGYITDIIPPQVIDDTIKTKVTYYSIDVQLSKASSNTSRLYLVGDNASNFLNRPAASINGYRIGARTFINNDKCEKLYVNISADTAAGESGNTTKSAVISPAGFKKWSSSLTTLSPLSLGVGDLDGSGIPDQPTDILFFNVRQDAANLIDANKTFIQAEAFGYILEKYPLLQTIPYVNPNITAETGRYRDASNLIKANRQEIIDYAFSQMQVAFPSFTIPGGNDEKCKRDIGFIVDALSKDLYDGGNIHIIEATKAYFDATGQLIDNGVEGEQTESIFAFNRARDWAKKAISNLLSNTSLLSVSSITASETTVTVTTSVAHELQAGQSVTVGGATQPQYNGQVTVNSTGLTATQFQYTVSSAPSVSPATGAYYVSTVIIDGVNDDPGVGRYKDASNLVTANRQEIIDRAAAEVGVQYPDFYYPGDPAETSTSRYKDSYRLIQQNKQEIVDRAFAEISLQYNETSWGSDWVVPGDSTVDDNNRYRDSFRLIQKNKQEIIDRAFGEIAIQYSEAAWGTDWVVPGDTTTTSLSRYFDSYRLIQKNRNIIVETAYATVVAAPPSPQPTDLLNKCKRDIGLFVDAVSLDILLGGGNVYTRKFTQQYFSGNTTLLTNGLAGEVTQSITAFNKARDAMKSAITNTLSSLAGVVTSSPAGGSWVDGTTGTKVVYIDTTITADPSPSSGTSSNTNPNSCSDVRSAIDTLAAIVSTTLTAVNLSTLPPENSGLSEGVGQLKCMRDIGYFIDAVSLDVAQSGGNRYSRKFVQQYFVNATTPLSNGLVGEVAQSVFAFNAARDMMKKALTNQLYVKDLTLSAGPATFGGGGGNIQYTLSGNSATCVDVQATVDTLASIIVSPITAGNLTGLAAETVGSVPAGEVKCKRDIGYFVDAVSLDIAQGGGNRYSRKFVQQYFTNANTPLSNGLVGEEAQSIVAFNYARDMMTKAVSNQLYAKDLTLPYGNATYNVGNSASDITYNQSGNAATCVDVQNAIVSLSSIVTDKISNPSSTLPPETTGVIPAGEAKCKRDLGYIIDSIAQDLFWGGNEFTVGAVVEYFANNTSLTTNGLSGEVNQSIVAFEAAKDQVKKAVSNQLYAKNLTLSYGESEYGDGNGIVTYNQSGNAATCVDVQNTVETLFDIITTTLQAQNLSALPPIDNGQWDCANVRNTIDTLTSIITTSLKSGSLAELPQEDPGQWSIVSDSSKCKRDIGYIVEAITSDLRLGGNEATVRAAEAYYTGNDLDYIENEKIETLDAYDYVRNLAISSMRNHNTYLTCQATGNSAVITVPSVNGLVIGMNVKSINTIPENTGSVTREITNYNDELEQVVNGRVVPKATNINDNIPIGAYIKKIGNGINGLATNQIELGKKGSKFDSGDTILAKSSLGSNVPVKLFFSLDEGVWSTTAEPVVDNTVIQDYNYDLPEFECSSVVNAINNYFVIITQIIENGLGVVDVEYSQLNTGSFAQRATLFTLTDTSQGAAPTDPHHLETGTPVRLVPRAREGSNVDKRLIRLPRGFDTNTVYYVIAPGRKTDPYDYSAFTTFNASAGSLQNLMLASSIENAASGIYIYSSETESVHPDVIIDVYQYVLDVKYDLNKYVTRKVSASGVLLETEEPHVFDIPTVAYNINNPQKYQAVFFKPIGSGSLPALSSGGTLSPAREYYVRYVDRKRFKVFDTIESAIQNTSAIQFANFESTFYTLSNKKRSPLRFAPEAGAAQSYNEVNLYVENKSLFANGDYVKVDDEFFFVTGVSPAGGSDYLIVVRQALGSAPTNHSTGAQVVKWNYLTTATTTTLTETVDTTETILDFTSTVGFVLGDYVRLSNSGIDSNNNVEVVKIVSIEGNQVIVQRAQLGTFALNQPGSVVTATKLQLSATTTLTTLSEAYPRLLTSVTTQDYAGGNWYLTTDSSKPNTILERIRRPDFAIKDKTPDTWYERIEDSRSKKDRVYRLRYVIPKYLKSVRDPLRGFVIKSRNDSTRRLLPQKILVKPVGSAPRIPQLTISNPTAALATRPDLPGYEFLGYTSAEHGPTFISLYDPYNPETNSEIDLTPKYRVKLTTDSKVTTYVQSARKKIVNGTEYLELTVFDTGIEEQGYKDKIFTTVRIDSPEGGNGVFVSNIANLPESNTSNIVTWSGACKGRARVHGYFAYENQYYMILKDITITSTLTYSPFETVTFQQGAVTANLIDYPDGGRSDKNNFLYVVEGSNVYTMTPGDTFDAPNGSYVIASVEDTQDIENTFYIFDVDEVRRRIFGQQDGIYYLTCMRANISPFPTGAGVGENFRNFRFSQPVSKLYPEFYKNDPEWFKQLDSSAIDPPATISAADNYVHGLVTVNDSKNSVTKEAVIDFINDRGTGNYVFEGETSIQAQEGGASAGSESRKISISGNSQYPTENKLYVELRRPSIARSGNHTFEYLGFGPGNYSTGFPARQEVVLTDVQDFYAQAKREDGGIVFYTGLNSNGDLYIGNRKINAITGEETFLESAELLESQDEADQIGNFVTTFDDPVVFNDIVSFLAPLENGVTFFSSPIFMDVGTIISSTGLDAPSAITIKTNINNASDDPTLAINPVTGLLTGDITIGENRIKTAIVQLNPRGTQQYSIRTAIDQFKPDQTNIFGQTAISFGTKYPLKTGDILLKGTQVGVTGSLGWIYSNDYQPIPSSRILSVEGFGSGNNYIRINWAPKVQGNPTRYTNQEIGISTILYQVRISGVFVNAANDALNTKIRGVWSIRQSTFNVNNNYVDINISDSIDTGSYDVTATNEPNILFSISNVTWKEFGVIGSEAIRTETDVIGDYKLGINTVARSPHSSYANSFVDSATTTPRANLDVVGTAFISGKKINSYLTESGTTKTETSQNNAFLVGGNSAVPDNAATFRVMTNNSGRVGINATNAQLDRSLVVVGNGRITGDFRFESDIEVNGGDITTTLTTQNFNFLNQSTYVGSLTDNAGVITTTGLNIANYAAAINIGNLRTDDQYINIANASDHVNVRIGNNPNPSASNISKINIGGAFNNNESQSFVSLDSKLTRIAGDLALSYVRPLGSTLRITVPTGSTVDAFNDATTLNLATNASVINFGGQGGNTTVRNSLTVDASLNVNGSVVLTGGLSSFDFDGLRAQLGTTRSAVIGTIAPPLEKPVDLITIVNGNVINPTLYVNQIDTAGSGPWGGNLYQNAITSITGPEPNNLPALTGNFYYLPLISAPVYNEGDFLIIDTATVGSRHPEIVRIPTGGLVRINAEPYYIVVERQPLGTFSPTRIDHPDLTTVRKVNVALDATWIKNNIDNSGVSDTYQLAEFGGQLNVGDYIIVNRNSSGTIGEFVKINSSSTTASRKLIINDGGGSLNTVFEVNSINGNTILGNPAVANSGNLTVYGTLTLSGGCGNGSTTSDRKLSFRNELYETVSINTCTGDATFGSQYATVFVVGKYFSTTAASHSTTTPVYVYQAAPETVQSGGPNTTIFATQQTGSVTQFTSNIPVASISGFSKGDLVLISSGIANAEIIRITDIPFTNSTGNFLPTSSNTDYPSGGRGQETTTAQSWNSGAVVAKILKDTRTTTLSVAIPATGRTTVELPNTNPDKIRIQLVNGDLISEKLDYYQLIRIDNEFFLPDSWNSAVDPYFGVKMPKSSVRSSSVTPTEVALNPDAGITKYFGGGNIVNHGDLTITSGNFRIYGTDAKTLIFNIANDDGHPGDGAILDPVTLKDGMFLNGFANIRGDIIVNKYLCQENGFCSNEQTFKVDSQTGSISAGQSLYVKGAVTPIASNSTPVLHIDNLGSAGNSSVGPKDFIMYQDGSIDAFGIKQFFTANGGRRWTYVSQSATGIGQTQANPLQPNNNYLVNLTSGGNMVLYLPLNAQTGDMIRFIEISGNLDYRTNLVIRALKDGVTPTAIQGDITGTKITAGSGSSLLPVAWDSGELVIQTRNASFGLLYVGNTDAPGDPLASEIPSNLRGWWLVEL